MTVDAFRKLALSLPETIESAHMAHPDFRVGGKIFATISPDAQFGMVKLTPPQQAMLIKAEPSVYVPVQGGWGARGATHVRLKPAKAASVREALRLAWRNTAPKKLAEQYEE